MIHYKNKSFLLLKIVPEPGWHLLWKNSEGSGLLIDWDQLPRDLDGNWVWNVPSRIQSHENRIGYDKEMKLIMQSSGRIKEPISGFFQWTVCNEECIEESAHLTARLENSHSLNHTNTIEEYLNKSSNQYPISSPPDWKTTYEDKEGKFILRLDTRTKSPRTDGKIDFYFDRSHNSLPLNIIQLSETEWKIEIQKEENLSSDMEILSGLILVGNEVYEASFVRDSTHFLLEAILFALLGGILLNLMPCVFPILTMKAMSVIQSSNLIRRERILDSVFYASGIIVFFLALYSILTIIRFTGNSIGWGFQLQNPLFVYLLALLFVVMGFQMFGWIEFTVGVSGKISKLSDKKGYTGSFFSGAIAVLVATPCTAPFMGTALAYALSESYWIGFLVFLSLAIGMALPITIITTSSSLNRFIPKPGVWMIRFKELLSFPLFLTSVWLLWILSGMIDRNSVFIGIAGIILFTMLVWLFKLTSSPIWKSLLLSLTIAMLLAIGVQFNLAYSQGKVQFKQDEQNPYRSGENDSITLPQEFGFSKSILYSEDNLNRALSSGGPVFLYFTADWCVTCKYNEGTVFSKNEIEEFFKTKKVRVIKADWTNEDESITKKLEQFGRNGVPLYVFYPKGLDSNPRILPQILTTIVLKKEISR